jgi:mono/diheme cytochrome c family protein
MSARVLLVFTLFMPLGAAAQKPKIQRVPARQTSAASGKAMFNEYCASCHGKDAKGDGPAAPALKRTPPDLTMLARRNGGKFPALHVSEVIRGGEAIPAHGSKEMPVWGPVFSSLSQGRQAEVQLRLDNLTRYIESLQQK